MACTAPDQVAHGFFFVGSTGGSFSPWPFAEQFVFFLLAHLFIGQLDGAEAYGRGVDHHFLPIGFEVEVLQVAAGGLQGVEEQASGLVVDAAGEQQARDLHQGKLDGVGVFEWRQVEQGDGGAFSRIAKAVSLAPLIVEVTELLGAQGGRAELVAIDLDVLAAGELQRFVT
jgi:hypothetical protein